MLFVAGFSELSHFLWDWDYECSTLWNIGTRVQTESGELIAGSDKSSFMLKIVHHNSWYVAVDARVWMDKTCTKIEVGLFKSNSLHVG